MKVSRPYYPTQYKVTGLRIYLSRRSERIRQRCRAADYVVQPFDHAVELNIRPRKMLGFATQADKLTELFQ